MLSDTHAAPAVPASPLRSRRFLVSAGITLTLLVTLLAAVAAMGAQGRSAVAATCSSPSFYSVTSSSPGPADWTSSIWSSPGYPGQGTCDAATDSNAIVTPISVTTTIPNGLASLFVGCNTCVIDVTSGGQLTIDGTGTVTAGKIRVSNGGSLVVNSTISFGSGTTLELADGSISGAGSVSVNGGTVDVGGSATSSVSVPFNVTGGSVNVNSGTLALSGGGTGDAPFTIASGATLDFPAGSYGLTTAGVVSGGGTLSISGGTLSIGGVTSPAGFHLSSGTLTGPGFLSIGSDFLWTGGTIMGNGGAELAGTGNGTIGDGSTILLDGRVFNDYGTITFNGTNDLTMAGTAQFNVFGTLNFGDDASITCADCSAGASVSVSPNGILNKTGGIGISVIAPDFTNSANVASYSGTLEIAGSGTHSGAFYAGTGAEIAFSASSTTFGPSSFVGADGRIDFWSGDASSNGTFSVNGTTGITGGELSINTSSTTRDFRFNGGELYLTAPFTMSGSGVWSNGTMDSGITGAGYFDVLSGATLEIDALTGDAVLDGTLFKNHGTVDYTATGSPLIYARAPRTSVASGGVLRLVNGATIENYGLFDLKTDLPILSGFTIIIGDEASKPAGTANRRAASAPKTDALLPSTNLFDNYGTLQKSSGTGTSVFQPDLHNNAGGVVKVLTGAIDFQNAYTQDGGATTLAGGNIVFSGSSPMALNGGTFDGAGSASGDVNNTGGTVSPGTASSLGTIALTGNYTQGSGGSLDAKLGASGASDVFSVSGTATLDGTFNGSLFSYTPANGDTWTPLTFASRTGAFAVVNVPPSICESYTPTSFVLTAAVAASADLQVLKTGPAGVVAGQNITYQIQITNYGPSPATNVVVSDPQPANLTWVSNSGACTTNFPCTLPSLASAQTVTINATYSTSPTFSGNVTNTVTVSSTASDPDITNNSASATTNVGAQADLSVSKSGPTTANTGQTISYTVVVTNAGPSPATNTVVSDPTPVGVAFVSNSGACASPYPCNLGTLAPNQTVSITSTYTIPGNYTGATVVNTATVTSDVNDPDTSDNTGSATTNVAQQTDMAIVKSGPTVATPGQPIVYTITVANNGPSAAANVVVTDPTPAGLTFVSNSGACTTAFPCNLGTMNPNTQATITTTYTVSPTYSSATVVNTATVSSAATDPNGANNSSTATTPISATADLSVTKSGPAAFQPGQNLVYTVAVTNAGTLPASNVFVSDPTPSGISFVSNSGGCATPYPCSIGTLVPGQTVTITSTYSVPATYAGTTVSNTATASTSSNDGNPGNNSGSVTTPLSTAGGADVSITKTGPGSAHPGDTINFTLVIRNNGPAIANSVVVTDPTPAGLLFQQNSGGCTTPFPCHLGTLAPQQAVTIVARYKVTAPAGTPIGNSADVTSAVDPDSRNNRGTARVNVLHPPNCPTSAPRLISPAANTTVSSPTTFSWSSVAHAAGYRLTITGPDGTRTFQTPNTSMTVAVPTGTLSWFVEALGGLGCGPLSSEAQSFNVCSALPPPTPSVVGESTTGQTYTVAWTPVIGASAYELQESTNASFNTFASFTVNGLSKTFTKQVQNATPFFYRVRPLSVCSQVVNPFSTVIKVVIVPLPAPDGSGNALNLPFGTASTVTFQVFVPGLPGVTTSFVATVDKPWLTVSPTSGIIGPDGTLLTISADPAGLSAGTWNGTVLVVYGTTGVIGSNGKGNRSAQAAAPSKAIPISINLTTPVSPAALTTPSDSAMLIPSVGHLPGVSSSWRSDIRIANTTTVPVKYQVSFNLANGDVQTLLKQTVVNVDAGATMALDDIVRNWYGVGSLSDSANGVLSIQALDSSGAPIPNTAGAKATVVSSRTYNAAAAGTLGQFIPATSFANFIGRAAGGAASSILSLQQIAQNDAYRTNLGLVEGAGKPVSLSVTVFDGAGSKVLSLPVSLAPGEQKQLNSFLAQNNITLSNGRVEVQVTGGEGRATAYASVVDNRTSDPLLVSGVPLGGLGANRFIVPGVADLNTPNAQWRSDLRVFNSSSAPQATTLTFFPIGNASAAVSKDLLVNPGEVKAVDNVLQALFGLRDVGGAVHVTTPADTPLVVTARTYDETGAGTVGQFIPAVTSKDAVGTNDRSLQILQVEDSVRYRTNLGIAEVSGKPVTAEVSIFLPDSKVSPKVMIPLAAYESRQFPILSNLGLGATYNARLSIRVLDGDGKVTAYGSVVDQATQDPTYVPAQ